MKCNTKIIIRKRVAAAKENSGGVGLITDPAYGRMTFQSDPATGVMTHAVNNTAVL